MAPRAAVTSLTRPLIALSLIFSFVCAVVWLLWLYYRPTVEFSEGEPLAALALAVILPFAFSAALAYTPALRQSSRLAATFCVGVGLAEIIYSRTAAVEDSPGIAFDAVLALAPMVALFTASRLPTTRRYPWTFLLVGPMVFWLGVLIAILISVFLIPDRNL